MTEGYCIHCGASMYRDGEGRLHARNPEPGCSCALREPIAERYTVDREADCETWFLWRGTPEDGEIITSGALHKVLTVMETLR